MSIETRTIRLVSKTGVKKSRWTVPLNDGDSGQIQMMTYQMDKIIKYVYICTSGATCANVESLGGGKVSLQREYNK